LAGPQSLVLMLIGRHVYPQQMALSSATFIDALSTVGVSEQATRSALARMVTRGLLDRHVRGRKAYFSTTTLAYRMLDEGAQRIFADSPAPTSDDTWTMLSFSIPEGQRSDRHTLRTNLAERGFGPVRNGFWLAPGRLDVTELIDGLDLGGRIEVFHGQPAPPTQMTRVIEEAWDLDMIREAHESFIARWGGGVPQGMESHLATETLLAAEWTLLMRGTPRLPAKYLSADWPAMQSYSVFHEWFDKLRPGAAAEFARLRDMLPVPESEPKLSTPLMAR
jgi:phenylacetic acid degradation operon negative regulatory protein